MTSHFPGNQINFLKFMPLSRDEGFAYREIFISKLTAVVNKQGLDGTQIQEF